MIDERLSRAVTLYFSHRNYPVEEQGRAELEAAFSKDDLATLVPRIKHIVGRTFDVGAEYSTLKPAAEAVINSLRQEHPELSSEAVDALVWYWRYCNR